MIFLPSETPRGLTAFLAQNIMYTSFSLSVFDPLKYGGVWLWFSHICGISICTYKIKFCYFRLLKKKRMGFSNFVQINVSQQKSKPTSRIFGCYLVTVLWIMTHLNTFLYPNGRNSVIKHCRYPISEQRIKNLLFIRF